MIRALALVAAFASCATIKDHPYGSTALANGALVIGSGVCAAECGGAARGISDGVLIGELAVSSVTVVLAIEFVVAYAEERK